MLIRGPLTLVGQLGVHTQAVMSMLMIRAAFADPPWVAQQPPHHPWILFGADFQEQSKPFFREHFPCSGTFWPTLQIGTVMSEA